MLGINLPAFQVTEQNRPRASNHLPSRFTRDLNILLQIVKIGRNWEHIFGKRVGWRTYGLFSPPKSEFKAVLKESLYMMIKNCEMFSIVHDISLLGSQSVKFCHQKPGRCLQGPRCRLPARGERFHKGLLSRGDLLLHLDCYETSHIRCTICRTTTLPLLRVNRTLLSLTARHGSFILGYHSTPGTHRG